MHSKFIVVLGKGYLPAVTHIFFTAIAEGRASLLKRAAIAGRPCIDSSPMTQHCGYLTRRKKITPFGVTVLV
jgi:hypothetical protein